MSTGKIKWYNARKGFGFIEQNDGGKDIFVHASAVKDAGFRRLEEGQEISFDVEDSPKGPNAINLKTADTDTNTEEKSE
tara:strand:- start:254 stop:490 length:237 start_codon:yes stop_codon:yes gene_type:complete